MDTVYIGKRFKIKKDNVTCLSLNLDDFFAILAKKDLDKNNGNLRKKIHFPFFSDTQTARIIASHTILQPLCGITEGTGFMSDYHNRYIDLYNFKKFIEKIVIFTMCQY